jgi:anti-anti-sigma factor
MIDRLQLDVWPQRGALVVRPRGELNLSSCSRLRDCLLKCMAEQPRAVLVELGDLRVRAPALLSVFASVWMRCATWTGVPLVLAATREPLRSMLMRSGVARFVATHPTLAQAWASVDEQPRRRRAEFSLSVSRASARRARTLVRGLCERWHLKSLIEDAVLVASELVDNAITQGCSALRLRVELRRTGLAVSVRSPEPTSRRFSRGLAIVAGVCLAWGQTPTADGGEITWAVLRLPDGRLAFNG